jgi:hypothetical protein
VPLKYYSGTKMSESERVPITVGVVGHIDINATEEQRLQITNFFCDLALKYPNSPVCLFSSIADGADRFVAKIFIELKHGNETFRDRFELMVPTPFCNEEYKKDFDEASKNEFETLIQQAKRSFCVGCENKEATRSDHYLKAGKFIADSSIILIALWDGEQGKRGGTADIVRHKTTGDNENVAESTFEYDGTVFVMPSNRNNSTAKIFSDSEVVLSIDIVLKDSAIKKALEKIEEINSESLTIWKSKIEKSRANLFNCTEKLDPPQKSLLSWYSILDVYSIYFRGKDIKITLWLFTIGFLMLTALEIYSNLFLSNLVLGIAMFLAFSATVIYLYSKNADNHKKYLYYRTLAEALRIQFYWNIAGINKNVSDYILRIHRKDFTWIKYIMSAIYGVTFNHKSITPESINDLIQNWVENQSCFFSSSVTRMTKQLGFFNRTANTCFIMGFALLVSIFFFGDFYKSHSLMNMMLVITGMLIGLFALIKGYIKMKGYEQLLNQYELMNVIYSRAKSKAIETETYNLDEDKKNSYLKELFFVVGKEALIENGNWYLIFKEREPEIKGI